MKRTIVIKWIENQKKYSRMVVRQHLLQKFENLIKAYPLDNEISAKLVKVIPQADYIQVDKDMNNSQDVPYITYKINGVEGMQKIIRHHKIVWQTLNEYCKD